jgi:CO dehydrogenase/acetyl-CoA synthase delta subunit
MPLTVDGLAVDAVRESWLVEDRWWTDRPLRRRYWEVVTTGGRNLVVFRELEERRWYLQR